jgi:hypothetical protein
MNEKSKIKHAKTTITVLLAAMIIGLTIGFALGIGLYEVSISKLGFWQGNVESTSLTVLAIRHQIQSSTKIRTIVEMRNTGATTTTYNCTLYYKNSSGAQIATHSFNTTINAGQTKNEAITITPINVNEFTGTDLSVFEY